MAAGIIPLIDSILGLSTEVFKYINSKKATKYLDEMTEIRKDILAEESKGYYSDDRLIEELLAKFVIVSDAARQEAAIFNQQKKT